MTTQRVYTAAEGRRALATGRLPDAPGPAVTNLEPVVDASTDGETQIQAEIIRELRALGFVAFHVPNGGKRRRIEAAILKGIGVLAGVADVGVLLPGGRISWLEAKSATGKQSPAQRRFASWCKQLGHEYHLVRTVGHALEIAARWERYDVGEVA